MSSNHIETKHRLKSIPDIDTFESILERSTLNDKDKEFIRLYYLRGKSLSYIADILGFSEAYVRQKHQKILSKIEPLI